MDVEGHGLLHAPEQSVSDRDRQGGAVRQAVMRVQEYRNDRDREQRGLSGEERLCGGRHPKERREQDDHGMEMVAE